MHPKHEMLNTEECFTAGNIVIPSINENINNELLLLHFPYL